MRRGIFEDGERLSMVSIFDINFAFDTNMAVYPTLSSDITELGDMQDTSYYINRRSIW